MSDGYTPRAGTTAHKILEFLHKQATGAAFTAQQLEEKLQVKYVTQVLKGAVEGGLVIAERQGNSNLYSLPAPPEPSDGKLTIASWSDGDVSVQGATIGEDESVTFTREQIEQLIAHVTTPHIGTIPALATFAETGATRTGASSHA